MRPLSKLAVIAAISGFFSSTIASPVIALSSDHLLARAHIQARDAEGNSRDVDTCELLIRKHNQHQWCSLYIQSTATATATITSTSTINEYTTEYATSTITSGEVTETTVLTNSATVTQTVATVTETKIGFTVTATTTQTISATITAQFRKRDENKLQSIPPYLKACREDILFAACARVVVPSTKTVTTTTSTTGSVTNTNTVHSTLLETVPATTTLTVTTNVYETVPATATTTQFISTTTTYTATRTISITVKPPCTTLPEIWDQVRGGSLRAELIPNSGYNGRIDDVDVCGCSRICWASTACTMWFYFPEDRMCIYSGYATVGATGQSSVCPYGKTDLYLARFAGTRLVGPGPCIGNVI